MRIVKLTTDSTKGLLENLLKRSPAQYPEQEKAVREILEAVKEKKDEALLSYTCLLYTSDAADEL